MVDRPRVQIPLIVTVERDLGDAKELVTYLGFPHACVEIADLDGSQKPFPARELLSRIVTATELDKGEAAQGESTVVQLDRLAELEAGRDPDVPERIRGLVRAKRSACRVDCAHAGARLLTGGRLTWIDAGEGGLWLVESAAGDEAAVVFVPSSPGAIATQILALLPA